MTIKENTPTLFTKRLILRRFQSDDDQALFELLSDEITNTYLPWFLINTLEEAQVFLNERFLNVYNQHSAYRYAITLKNDNRPIGYVWLSLDQSNDFGYALKKEYWNQGIVTEAALAVVHRIKDAGYAFITATHDKNNIASGEVMKHIGMSYQYSYIEQWLPKNIPVTFRMYQLNFQDEHTDTYMEYWNKYDNHFIEKEL